MVRLSRTDVIQVRIKEKMNCMSHFAAKLESAIVFSGFFACKIITDAGMVCFTQSRCLRIRYLNSFCVRPPYKQPYRNA